MASSLRPAPHRGSGGLVRRGPPSSWPAGVPRKELGLLWVLGSGLGPLSHLRTPNSRRAGKSVLRPFLGETGRAGHVDRNVLADPPQRLSHFVQVLSEPRSVTVVGHGSRPMSPNSWSKSLRVDGNRSGVIGSRWMLGWVP